MKASRHPMDRSPMAAVIAIEAGRNRRKAITCRLQDDVLVGPARLGNYCFTDVSDRVEDLIVISGVIAFADRSVSRSTSKIWQRHVSVSIPVLDSEFWQQCMVKAFLSEMLNTLTGDFWTIEFRRKENKLQAHQANLAMGPNDKSIVIPYSDGMDSFIGAKLQLLNDPCRPVLLVTLGQKRDPEPLDKRHRQQRYRFSVPFTLKGRSRNGHRLREQSFRSRALIYTLHAGLAAHLSGANEVIVPESGQGALGPWLVPVGNEALDIRMHPMFTNKVSQLLKLTIGADVRFVHPYLWNTKGEVLKQVVASGNGKGWERTRSCAQDARTASTSSGLAQCGVCSACLLRRQSVHAAGLREAEGVYLFDPGLTVKSGSGKARDSHRRQAMAGLLQLDDLAGLALPDESNSVILNRKSKQLAIELGMPQEDVLSKLTRMLCQHREEWLKFVGSYGGLEHLLCMSRGKHNDRA